jgi:TP901 family phage tail tape measure protein
MANDGSVIIDIEGDSSKFKSALSGLGSIASTALKGVTTAVAAVTTAVAGVATAAVKVGSGFESSMSQVAATMGLTVEDIRNGSEEFELLSQAAKDAGATTAFSASEAADALNYLALAGYDAATSADVLPSVLNLAAAGGLDLAYASDLATDAMAALGIEASSANLTEFGDKMAKTASKANTSVSQLGEAILTVGGTAKSLAGGTTELNAALGVLANRGIKGAEGGTALRNVILALSAPTDKAADAMSALGLEVYDAAGNMRPLNEVFRDLDSALSGMTEGEKTKVLNEIFNKVDLKSAQALLAGCGDKNNDKGEEFDTLAAAIDDSAGAMQNMADTQLDNLQGDITIMKSALEGLGIGVYENLQAPLRDTVQFATELVGQLSEALNENGLEGLVSAAGDVLSEVLLKITSELPKFIDIGVKVIKSLISGLLKNKKTLVDSAIEIGKVLVSGLGSILGDLTLAALEIITTLADSLAKEAPALIPAAVEAVLQFVEGLLSTENISALIDAALALLTGLVEGLIAAVPIIIEAAPIIIENLVTAILDNLPQIIECAITLLNALTQGLLDNLPLLVDAAIELTLAIAEGLIEALPDLIDAALDLVGALVDTIFATDWLALGAKILESLVKGILSLIGSLFEAAGKIVSTIWDKITNTEWFQKGAEVLTKIINGIKSIFTNLAQTASDLVKKITDKITNTEWFQKGSEILTKIIDGIKSLFSNLGRAASDLVSQVWDTITNTNWLDLGRNIIEGIANGVSNAVGTLVQAAKNVANSALNAIKSALGIASPSKVFAKEVGRWIPPGIGKGVDQAMPELTDDMRAQLQDLIDDANVSVATEVGGLSSKLALTANSGSGGSNHSQTITNDNGIIVYVTYNGDGSEEDARRVGKQIGAETAREIRRRGLAPT